MCIHIYIYIYIEREREREIDVCEINTPPEKQSPGEISLDNSTSGAGEELPLLDCTAKARRTYHDIMFADTSNIHGVLYLGYTIMPHHSRVLTEMHTYMSYAYDMCTYIYIYIYIYVYIHIYIYRERERELYIYIYMFMFMFIYMCVCMYMYMYVYIYIYTHMFKPSSYHRMCIPEPQSNIRNTCRDMCLHFIYIYIYISLR